MKMFSILQFCCFVIFLQFESYEQQSCSYGYVTISNSCSACGNVTFKENVRIVGGIPAVANSWPAQVLVSATTTGYYYPYGYGSYYTAQGKFLCGGTLIDQYTVLTAGHCVVTSFTSKINGISQTFTVSNPYDGSQYTVYVGVNDDTFWKLGSTPAYPVVAMSVSKVIRNPDFTSTNYLNDVAILKFTTAVTLNSYVQPACLPNPSYGKYPSTANISSVYASGWGALSYSGSTSNTLYNVQLNSYPSSYCSNVYPSYTKNWDSQICAGNYSGGKDTCQGDSGGGLYAYDSTISRFVVVGITSYGYSCAAAGYPGIYTRVSYFYSWITSNMGPNCSSTFKISSINLIILFFCSILFNYGQN